VWRDHRELFIQGLSRLVKPYLHKGCDGFGPVWRKVFHLAYRYRRLSETLGPFFQSRGSAPIAAAGRDCTPLREDSTMREVLRAHVLPARPAEGNRPPCLLCDKPARAVGVYLPGPGRALSPVPGWDRTIVYPLCAGCAKRFGELTEAIEAKIESECQAFGLIPSSKEGRAPALKNAVASKNPDRHRRGRPRHSRKKRVASRARAVGR